MRMMKKALCRIVVPGLKAITQLSKFPRTLQEERIGQSMQAKTIKQQNSLMEIGSYPNTDVEEYSYAENPFDNPVNPIPSDNLVNPSNQPVNPVNPPNQPVNPDNPPPPT